MRNFTDYTALANYTVVATATETIHDAEFDEIDGAFVWIVYHNDSDTVFVGRLDVMSGELKQESAGFYRNNAEYARCFAESMAILYERTTGLDFVSACPRK